MILNRVSLGLKVGFIRFSIGFKWFEFDFNWSDLSRN